MQLFPILLLETSQTQARGILEIMQQPQVAPEMTTTRWAPSVLFSILPSSNAMAMNPVPMGLDCFAVPEGHTTVWGQLRSQINVWGRRLLWRPSKERHVTCASQDHTVLANETFPLVWPTLPPSFPGLVVNGRVSQLSQPGRQHDPHQTHFLNMQFRPHSSCRILQSGKEVVRSFR